MFSIMKLYTVSDGPPSLAVRMALKVLNIPHEHIPVDYGKGEHLTEEYALMNPQKEIPVLDDDGFFLSESNAILQYLCEKYSQNTYLYPEDPKQRAIVNHRLCFNLAFLYPQISAYVMAPIFFDYERTPLGLKKLQMALDCFETYMNRQGTKFVAGDHLTIADFPLVSSVMCLEAINFDIEKYSLVKVWYHNFKKEYPELWAICATGMAEIREFEKNPPDLSGLNHPIHPIKKIK
ncbi:glutathione S-transferase 1-1 isoform X3 [Toxorhynchites rutilus septentrionalis]|uniref:glutathione S-transferase 1-1 isoform X3 n=1 Tax=Toxorhynchites rutilus septentrionalis TaxID=329112 RepID=UPI00247B1648|nr:glutathione S-transferase 1-1 isoform X3 [Toxorhynchites rutilus septentrionalis]